MPPSQIVRFFGTPKPARDLTKARSRKAQRDLDAGRLDPDKTLKD